MRTQTRDAILFWGLIAAIVIVFFGWVRPTYIEECVRSGHTQGWCEMEFWK